MSSLTIIIPTVDRPKKLRRTLKQYKEFLSPNIKIYILDGGKKDVSKQINLTLPKNFFFLKYKPSTITKRIFDFISNYEIDTKYVCLGTDEDVLISSYLQKSINFLEKNKDFSGYYGSVITFLKPFLLIPRVSFHKSTPQLDLFIDSDNSVERIMSYIALNSNVVPFTYYSTRRTEDFLNLYKKINSLKLYEMSEELLDQIHIAYSGKMFFNNEIMMIRDESKIKYKIEEVRMDPIDIIPESDVTKILDFLKQNYNLDFRSIELFLNAIFKNKLFLYLASSGYQVPKKRSIFGKKISKWTNIYLKISLVLLEVVQYIYLKFYALSNKELLKAIKKIEKPIKE